MCRPVRINENRRKIYEIGGGKFARAATAGKAGKIWSLPRFRSYKKQLVKNYLGRILDLVCLKFAMAGLFTLRFWASFLLRLLLHQQEFGSQILNTMSVMKNIFGYTQSAFALSWPPRSLFSILEGRG